MLSGANDGCVRRLQMREIARRLISTPICAMGVVDCVAVSWLSIRPDFANGAPKSRL